MLINNFNIGKSGSCSGIYCFENLLDGKKYVGQGQVLKTRKGVHLWMLDSENYRDSKYFQEAWDKDGKENFKLWIVEECLIELLNEKEVYWIAKLHSYISEWGYNQTLGGWCVRGFKHSKETIEKMSGENNHNFGKKFTKETIQKIRESRLGTHPSAETIQKLKDNHADSSGKNNSNWGKRHSPEVIQKMKDNSATKGKHLSPETIQKMKDNRPDNSGINNYRIMKEEMVQQIKNMLANGISVKNIIESLGVSESTIYRVKNGRYKNIYGIEGIT